MYLLVQTSCSYAHQIRPTILLSNMIYAKAFILIYEKE